MRKWLVGLLALACAAATSFAEGTATLPLEVKLTDKSTAWTSLPGFTAQGLGSIYANGNAKFDTTGDWMMVQVDSDPGELTFDVTGNTASGGEGTISFLVEESADGETWDPVDNLTDIATGTASKGPYTLAAASRYVRWTYANKVAMNIGLNNIGITSGGPAEFSVTFNKENWFKVALGEASSVTAIPKHGVEPYTFLWDSDTPELKGGTTDTLEIPATLAEGDYTVLCQVTDDNGAGDVINALIGFTVEAIPVITGGSATYTVTGKSKVEASGDVPTGSTAEYSQTYGTAGQATKENSMTLTLKGYEGMTITGLTLSMKSNKSAGAGSLSVTCEDAVIASIEDSAFNVGWSDAYTLEYVDVTPEVTPTAVTGDVTITIAASVNSLYCQSYTVQFEAGEPGLGVTFDKANGFTVDLGTPDSITATAKNGVEPYTYAWTSDTPDLNGTGETLAIPATLAEGDYTVMVTVTDAESNVANKLIGFTVVAPLEPHAINIDVGIQNGTVTSDPEGEAVKGTQVKLTATATTEGYALKEMTVTYGETVLTFTASPATFEMPDEAVSVGAVFAEVKDYAELPFVAEDTPYSGPWKTATVDGLTSKGLGTDYGDGAAKLDSTGDWLQVKFAGTPGTLSYGIKGNSVSADNPSTFLVQESADGETWSPLATYVSGDNLGDKTEASHELSASSQFVRFFYETKGAGNVGIYDVYITSGGPATFSIKLDPASYFEVEVGEEASIAATPKNAEGEVHYAWTVGGEPAGSDSAVLGLDTTTATEEIEVVCTATDGADTVATASVSYKVVAPAPKFQVGVAIGIPHGSVSADKEQAEEGELVTLTSSPEAGYKLGTFLLDGEAIPGNTFNMPAHDVLVSAEFIVKPVVAGFTKITSLDELTEGEYVLVGSDTNGAYGAVAELTGSTKVLSAAAVTIEDDTVVDAEESQIWTLAQVEGGWTIYNEALGFLGYSGSQNSAMAEAESSEKSTWTFSVVDGELFKVANVGTEGRTLRYNYNKGNMRFACYTSDTLPNIGLYKGSSGPVAFSIALNPAEDFEVQQGKDAAITATVRGAQGDVTYSWSVNGTPIDLAGNVYAIDSAEVGGPFTVVCEASDGVSDPVSASVSYTVVEVPPVTGDEFELISSLEDLEDGAEYVITDNTKAYAMKAELSSGSTKRLLNEAVEPVDDVITTEDASIIWKLVEDADGNYAFYNESAGKYIGWSSGNSAKLQDDAFANTISYEDELFVVMATSTAELDKPRKLQFNSASNSLQFAYYEGTQKNLNFFKKAGASAPKIVYSGETTIALGDTFEIIFGLLNYEGDFEWVLDSREGGSIVPDGRDGLYTWTPTAATDGVTIKVVARNGELDIASKEVTLTVTEPGPQPGEPALVFGGDSEGTVGTPVNFTVEAVNMANTDIYGGWTEHEGLFDAPEGSALSDAGVTQDFPNVCFTPDVAGQYVFYFNAGEGDEYREGSWTVTVTGEGPGPQPSEAGITKMTIAAGKMTIEFFGEGAQVLVSDDLETWTPVNGAVSPYTIEMGSDPQYIGVR